MEVTNLTNHFIIAMPGLNDVNFDHTVTYICEHDENGAFGIVVNVKTDITFDEVITQMNIATEANEKQVKNIFAGGPVQQDRGFILHHPPGNWTSSLQVNDRIALTTSQDILKAIAQNKGPENALIALGYAGWGPGQLEDELAANTWLSCPAEEQIIFDTPIEKRWHAAAKLIGVDLQLLSSSSGHA